MSSNEWHMYTQVVRIHAIYTYMYVCIYDICTHKLCACIPYIHTCMYVYMTYLHTSSAHTYPRIHIHTCIHTYVYTAQENGFFLYNHGQFWVEFCAFLNVKWSNFCRIDVLKLFKNGRFDANIHMRYRWMAFVEMVRFWVKFFSKMVKFPSNMCP
jgi:hypothetical protein